MPMWIQNLAFETGAQKISFLKPLKISFLSKKVRFVHPRNKYGSHLFG